MKIQELNLTKEDKIALFNDLTNLYIAIKGKGLYKIIEIEKYEIDDFNTPNTIKIKRDLKGRFVKRS